MTPTSSLQRVKSTQVRSTPRPRSGSRRIARAAALAAPMALAACAGIGPGGEPGPAAQAPTYQVGDRWVYRAQDGFRNPVRWEETHEIVAVSPQGITVRVTAKGDVNGERTEQWTAPGVVQSGAIFENETKRFEPPMERFRYPLTPGTSWRQTLRDPQVPPGPYAPIDRIVSVGGYERVTTPAGTFDAIRLRVFQRLDDETFWREATQANWLVWYAPAVGAPVREQRDAFYREKGAGFDSAFDFPAQHAQVELVATNRAR